MSTSISAGAGVPTSLIALKIPCTCIIQIPWNHLKCLRLYERELHR